MFNISSIQLVISELNVLKHVTSRHAEAAYPKTTTRQTWTVSPIEKPLSESQKGKTLHKHNPTKHKLMQADSYRIWTKPTQLLSTILKIQKG